MKNKEVKEKKKLTLKERLKDKREKAKLELMIYGIFFLIVIIFVRITGSMSSVTENNETAKSFINLLNDNYEYNIKIAINDNLYEYYGKVLGNNSTINLKTKENIKKYKLINDKYYILEDSNYILTDIDEVYPYLNYRYLNINNIRSYIKLASIENNTYKIKVTDLVLNSTSDEYLTINVNEGDNTITIDYLPLLKLSDNNIESVEVVMTYSNIDKIISLEE